jgi:hypothetical protein
MTEDFKPIELVGVIPEEVGSPRNDGTRGSALYRVPFRLSAHPSSRWSQFFVANWNRPPSFTTMHRPGIARVAGDTVVLDGTTMEEVEKYHLQTLKLAIGEANKLEAAAVQRNREAEQLRAAAEEEHRRHVEDVAGRLDFDPKRDDGD